MSRYTKYSTVPCSESFLCLEVLIFLTILKFGNRLFLNLRKVVEQMSSRPSSKKDLILHPIRLRLLTELTGRTLTSKQLADLLPDVPQASLYRHIKVLAEGGVFETVQRTPVRGAIERTYAVAKGQGRLGPEDLESMSVSEHQDAFHLFVGSLSERLGRYLETADLSRLKEDGMSFNGTAIYLSAAEREEFTEQINELVERFVMAGPSPDRTRYTLASIVIPEDRSVTSEDSGSKR